MKLLLSTLAAASVATLISCTEYQQQGAAIGALGGAALGALAGDDTDDVVRGAAIGAAAGTGAAALHEEHQRRQAGTPASHEAPPVTGQAPSSQPRNYPKGFKTTNPNQVISPYKPNNLIDISKNPKTGQPFRSGDYVIDPSNNKIFQLP